MFRNTQVSYSESIDFDDTLPLSGSNEVEVKRWQHRHSLNAGFGQVTQTQDLDNILIC